VGSLLRLLFLLRGLVVADHAPSGSAQHAMPRQMAGDATDRRTLQAAFRLRRANSCAGRNQSEHHCRYDKAHALVLYL
jgi:hypothetical protein